MALPPQAIAFARNRIGVITLRIDVLNQKSRPFCEVTLLEEFYHLIDYKGDSTPQEKEFWTFSDRYSLTEDRKFVLKVVAELNSHFNHYNINKFMMKYDLTRWLDYKRTYYGKEFRQRLENFYTDITSKYSQKKCSAILITETVKVISFSRAIESFIQENESFDENVRQILNEIRTSNGITILEIEQYTTRQLPKAKNSLVFFSLDSFTSKNIFFNKICQFWSMLDLIK